MLAKRTVTTRNRVVVDRRVSERGEFESLKHERARRQP